MDTFAFRETDFMKKYKVFEVDHPQTQADKLKRINRAELEIPDKLFSSEVKRVQNMIAMAGAGGEPMKSCFEYAELEKNLEKHRFLIYELMTTQDIQAQYFEGRESKMTAFEHINYITAVCK